MSALDGLVNPASMVRRRAAGVRAALAACLLAAVTAAAQAAPAWVLNIQGPIGPATADYVAGGLAAAAQAGAPLAVIEIDTPGGLDTAMRQIVQSILASPVPVAVYVWPSGGRAASAGTYILYAAHIAAMAPATTLGAATPVAIGLPNMAPRQPGRPAERPDGPPPGGAGGQAKDSAPAASGAASDPGSGRPIPLTDAMAAKQVHDAAAFIRGLAQRRGRNAEWAERAVREAVSLTAEEALRENVVDIVAADLPQLLERIDGRRVEAAGNAVVLATRGLAVERLQPDWRQRLLGAIAHPGIALVLMMLGVYGLLFEFASPGFGVTGVAGAICLLLGLFALQLLPVNYAGLALMALAVALWVAELLTPSFGVLGVGGVVAFIAGGVMLFDRGVPGFELPLSVIVGLAFSSALITLGGGHFALKARRHRVVTGAEEMIGAAGTVSEVDGDGTWARVHGERWRVRSDAELAPGEPVRVTGIDGLVLTVRRDAAPLPPETPQGGSR